MHRIASLSGDGPNEDFILIEQPCARILFLSSASSDISAIASSLTQSTLNGKADFIRAIELDCLKHPSQVDHYLSSTGEAAELIVVRLIGGRGHWSYGLDQLSIWKEKISSRILVVISGTLDQEDELHHISNIDNSVVSHLAQLFREGGSANILNCLEIFNCLLSGKAISLSQFKIRHTPDPQKWEWGEEKGPSIGLLYYKSLVKSGDFLLLKEINRILRNKGFSPKTLLISTLRNDLVNNSVLEIFKSVDIQALITATSFSSLSASKFSDEGSLWQKLDVPVFQILNSRISQEDWLASHRGLDPLDLSIQVVLPELDGRITTRPTSFKDNKYLNDILCSRIQTYKPYSIGINWLCEHISKWISLRTLNNFEKKVCIVLANYPPRNGRIANGVGLDTPNSTAEVLNWLHHEGYDLGDSDFFIDGNQLIKKILSVRTNDPESSHKDTLDYLPLESYQEWWSTLSEKAKAPILERWGEPSKAIDRDKLGFAVHGIAFGKILVLIQPSRGYDQDSLKDLHSPDLPPPHRYLAQYLWIRRVHSTNIIMHMGKHGSIEWLPGKAVGLSEFCSPDYALGPLPHIYPFIVNDPGEGSQAKRRSQAVIIDHLTPPLGRAGLYGKLLTLENLLDEYIEAKSISAERVFILEEKINKILIDCNWPGITKSLCADSSQLDFESRIDLVEAYLCELKESQIRTGLHIFGKSPTLSKIIDLALCIARVPKLNLKGLTQSISDLLLLELDPWSDKESDDISNHDKDILSNFSSIKMKRKADAIDWIESQARLLIIYLLKEQNLINLSLQESSSIEKNYPITPIRNWYTDNKSNPILVNLIQNIFIPLLNSASEEKKSLLRALQGNRVSSGPSGAPTRGRQEVLPTGKNFYSVDLRGLPTESAWDLGKRSAEQLLEIHLMENGVHLSDLALSVWGTSTMRNGGEDIAQLFALMGVKPIWDGPSRRMIDLEVIPLTILGRPRVDVLLRISGFFRDAFPQLVGWVNFAQELIGSLKESDHDNPLVEKIRTKGPQFRVFGSAPGSYGAGIQGLIDSSNWETRSDLADAYLSWSQWSYDRNCNPIENRLGLESSLRNIQVVLHNQDNREHDIFDSDDYYQFHGGLASAVEKVKGEMPNLFFGDHSRPEKIRIHSLEKEIDKVMRSRVLNPIWQKGMMEHGFKGAFEIGATVDYIFAYGATTGKVDDWCFSSICNDILLHPKINQFLKEVNPWVMRDIAERLMESVNRKLWKEPSKGQIDKLKKVILDTDLALEKFNYNRNDIH